MSADEAVKGKKTNKKRLSQTDVPAYSLEHALRVPTAVFENYAGKPTKPIDVAAAMELLPNSSQFRMITGSAIAYGLTDGGPNSSEIGLTDLSQKILQPLEEGVDIEAKREALLKPRVVGEFINKYNGSPIPKDQIAQNVLISMGVPSERANDVLAMILEGAESLGLITEIKGRKYVNLTAPKEPLTPKTPEIDSSDYEEEDGDPTSLSGAPEDEVDTPVPKTKIDNPSSINKKVFITHGRNKTFIEPIKKLLSFGEMADDKAR